jgi:hypothetical protein
MPKNQCHPKHIWLEFYRPKQYKLTVKKTKYVQNLFSKKEKNLLCILGCLKWASLWLVILSNTIVYCFICTSCYSVDAYCIKCFGIYISYLVKKGVWGYRNEGLELFRQCGMFLFSILFWSSFLLVYTTYSQMRRYQQDKIGKPNAPFLQ